MTVVNPVRGSVRRPGRSAAGAAVPAVAAVVASPLHRMVPGAFEPAGETESDRPRPRTPAPSPDFFRRLLGQREFGRHFVNGVVVAGGVAVVPALIAFLAATAATRFRFRFRTTPPIMFPAARTVPVEALAIPPFFRARDFGPLNTPGSPIPPRRLLGALRDPDAAGVRERGAAPAGGGRIADGSSRSRILRRILFPPVPPGLIATSVLSPIRALDDLLFAKSLVVKNTSRSTTTMALPVFFVLVQRRPVCGPGGAVKD